MLYRNFLAMETEELLRCHPIDGAILLGGCDKTTPGLLMGAISMNLPAIYCPAGFTMGATFRGERFGPGMAENGMLPIPKKLVEQGIRDMVRISDARMSGTSFGTCVLHVSPESWIGGPLALVRDGDEIELNVPSRSLKLCVYQKGCEENKRRGQLCQGGRAGGMCRYTLISTDSRLTVAPGARGINHDSPGGGVVPDQNWDLK